jgi:putative transcriptional regulator
MNPKEFGGATVMAPRNDTHERGQITVTSENLGDLLIESAKEAVAIKEGRAKPAVLRQYPVTARNAKVAAPPVPTAEEIREIREELKLSQPVFSAALNVSPATSRAWEQRKRVPDGPSLRLLQIVRENPAILLAFVRTTKNGKNGKRKLATNGRRR